MDSSDDKHLVELLSLEASLLTDLQEGLSSEKAALRLARDGPNVLTPARDRNSRALARFRTSCLAAMGGEDVASGLVLTLRNGEPQEVAPEALVRGDVVMLWGGCVVNADARVLEVALEPCASDHSVLTGESEPQPRMDEPTDDNMLESRNMLFKSTRLESGFVRALVVRTGDDTVMGRIASLVSVASPNSSPLSPAVIEALLAVRARFKLRVNVFSRSFADALQSEEVLRPAVDASALIASARVLHVENEHKAPVLRALGVRGTRAGFFDLVGKHCFPCPVQRALWEACCDTPDSLQSGKDCRLVADDQLALEGSPMRLSFGLMVDGERVSTIEVECELIPTASAAARTRGIAYSYASSKLTLPSAPFRQALPDLPAEPPSGENLLYVTCRTPSWKLAGGAYACTKSCPDALFLLDGCDLPLLQEFLESEWPEVLLPMMKKQQRKACAIF